MSARGKKQYFQVGIVPTNAIIPASFADTRVLKDFCSNYVFVTTGELRSNNTCYVAGLKSKAKYTAKPEGEEDNLGVKEYKGDLSFTIVGVDDPDASDEISRHIRHFTRGMSTVFLIDPFTGYVRRCNDILLQLEESVTGNEIEEFNVTGTHNGSLEEITSVAVVLVSGPPPQT